MTYLTKFSSSFFILTLFSLLFVPSVVFGTIPDVYVPNTADISNEKNVKDSLIDPVISYQNLSPNIIDELNTGLTGNDQVTESEANNGINSISSPQSAPNIEWAKTYGGSNWDDNFASLESDGVGGYVLAGRTASNNYDVSGNHGDFDMWIFHIDQLGNILWQKCLGGSGLEHCYTINRTLDGGYLLAGYTGSNNGDITSNHGEFDLWAANISSNGVLRWQKTFGGSHTDNARSLIQTEDGGFIAAGHTNSTDGDVKGFKGIRDYWVIKVNNKGNLEWSKCLGGSGDDYASIIQKSNDGNYIIAGYTNSTNGDIRGNHGGYDYWVVKLSPDQKIIWQKCYGGTKNEILQDCIPTSDGGYILTGHSNSNNGDIKKNYGGYDWWIVKISSDGAIQWKKTFGGSKDDEPNRIIENPGSGYICVGFSKSNNWDVSGNHGLSDFWVIKISNNGSIIWKKCLGGSRDDIASFVKITPDGGMIIGGDSFSNNGDVSGNHGQSDYWLVKLSTVDPTPTPTITPTPTPGYGSLSVSSRPTGANIWIDATDTGRVTKATITTLATGPHQVRLSKSGYVDYLKNVTIQDGKTTTISAILTTIGGSNGSIFAYSTPSGAKLFVDGIDTGYFTPKTIPEISAGSHLIIMRKDGYQDWSKEITVRARTKTTVYGRLTAVGSPSQAASSPVVSGIISPVVQVAPIPMPGISVP